MTLEELVAQINIAQERTPRGKRPSVVMAIATKLTGKLAQFDFNGAKITGEIIGTADIRGKPTTAIRIYCDDAMTSLAKAGLCKVDEPDLNRIVGNLQ